MIPALNASGVLPPYVGGWPAAMIAQSPYSATMLEVAQQFCTSAARVGLFRGLLSFRAAIVGSGITEGEQWIDGSFCENVEATRGRPPQDIDVVTLFRLPAKLRRPADWLKFSTANQNIFDRVKAKATYQCDVSFIDTARPAYSAARQITYWYGIFTHQRTTFMWKGIVTVPLASDDSAALNYANGLTFPP